MKLNTVVIILMIIILIGCSKIAVKKEPTPLEQEICKEMSGSTGHRFWFIYGLDEDNDRSTNIRYRGILYSSYLERLEWPQGLEIGLEGYDATASNYENMRYGYKSLLKEIEIESMAEKKAKELFGLKTNLHNDGSTTEYMYNVIVKKAGEEVSWEKKVGYYYTVVNVFCDNLAKIDEEEYREKTYKLAKYIFEHMNYRTALQVFVRDNSYFKNYGLIYSEIYPPFIGREDIKVILEKIKKQEELSEEDKLKIVKGFRKGSLDYRVENYKKFKIFFTEKEDFPIEKSRVEVKRKIAIKK